MRYYLDTNVLIFVLTQNDYSICREVQHILDDYSNRFYISSVAVQELIYAYKAKGIEDTYYQSAEDLFNAIEASNIEIVPMNRYHLLEYTKLETAPGHKDPNDHIIIAQAISDKIPIISSDRKFKEYIWQGLGFVYNRR